MRYVSLIIATAAIITFILQVTIQNFTESFVLFSPDAIARPWILVTSMFLHGGTAHLLGNMFALGVFGLVLENKIGSKKFIAVYFIGGVVANIVSIPFYESSLGASGAIFAVLGTLAVLEPRMIVFALGVPMPMVVAAGLWLILDIAGAFYPTNVANVAHIAGLIFGALAGTIMRKQYTKSEAENKIKEEKMVKDEEFGEWEDEWM